MSSQFDCADVERLLNVSSAFDEIKVQALEKLVNAMLVGQAEERKVANDILSRLKANEESWRIVGTILQSSTDSNTRFFALSLLEECIQTRWNILSEEQKNGVKQYITDLAITLSNDSRVAETQYFLTKVNKVLVQVVKQDWPYKWPSFIPDLCAAARTNQGLCENSMKILSLLSEEVFDFGHYQLTSRKMKIMMASLNEQFQQIYDLCMFVIRNAATSPESVSQSLLLATLQCLKNHLKWIPYEYIFDTGIIEILLSYFWNPPQYRIDCVRCLTEITSLTDIPAEYCEKLGSLLWCPLVQKVSELTDATLNYHDRGYVAQTRFFWETFYYQLTLCLTSLLRNYRILVCEVYPDSEKGTQFVIFVFDFLNKITSITPHEETFKICVDYWHSLAESLSNEVHAVFQATHLMDPKSAEKTTTPCLLLNEENIAREANNTIASTYTSFTPSEHLELYSDKLRAYKPILVCVRKSLILKMARPQEVRIRYDEETGTVERDYEIDTDEVSLYNNMRETLVYLTYLGGEETQQVLTELLQTLTNDAKNPNQCNWNPTVLNRLCWALGSISGAMSVERERMFLVHVIKELLWLCEHKRGKGNKAIVASMIMYVFGQYPRFLTSYVRFLETVISKLFEFMQETFPGVQEMACETFLKISQKCAKALATPSETHRGNTSILESILPQLFDYYTQLQVLNKQLMLYEGVGCIIACGIIPLQDQEAYIQQLCAPFSTQWAQIMLQFSMFSSSSFGSSSVDGIFQPQVARKLTEILRIYERIASKTGAAFSKQLSGIYLEMLQVYSIYSTKISEEIAKHGNFILSHSNIKALRSVKRASLILVRSYVEAATTISRSVPLSLSSSSSSSSSTSKADYSEEIAHFIIPPFLQPVLKNYSCDIPQARDFEVLSLLASLAIHLNCHVVKELPQIVDYVFDSTLDMIKQDFHSFPDHRTEFYNFLKACAECCFDALFALPEKQQRYFIEALLWAMKHEQPAVAEQGLIIMQVVLKKIATTHANVLIPFCQVFYWSLLRDVLEILTDTLHKAGFQLQTLVLMYLVQFVELGKLNSIQITKAVVMNYLCEVLMKSFVNLNRNQVEVIVVGLFNKSGDAKAFSQHLRDFLIQLKEFAGSEDLFEADRQDALRIAEELEKQRLMQVPGLTPQYTNADRIKLEDLE